MEIKNIYTAYQNFVEDNIDIITDYFGTDRFDRDMELIKWKMGLPNVINIVNDLFLDWMQPELTTQDYIELIHYLYSDVAISDLIKLFFSEYEKWKKTRILGVEYQQPQNMKIKTKNKG